MQSIHYTLGAPKTSEEFAQYFEFRWEQLRKPLGLAKDSEQDELELQSFHCMARNQATEIIAVGRIHFDGEKSSRIRYMAVAESYRNNGIGGAILKVLVDYAQTRGAHLVWLKARESAIQFYAQHGFDQIDQIDSDLTIPHVRMEMKLV